MTAEDLRQVRQARSEMVRRLLAVQGPLQYITGRIAFDWKRTPGSREENTLLLYDFLCSPEVEGEMADAIMSLAKKDNWSRVVHIRGEDMRAIMRGRYSLSKEKLRRAVGSASFDEIYLARDHVGDGSPLLLNSYQDASKFAYGDSFGVVGQHEIMKRLDGPRSLRGRAWSFARDSILGKQAEIRFDAAVLTLPIDLSGKWLKTLPLEIPSHEHVARELASFYDTVPALGEYCETLCAQAPSERSHLFLLSNLAASGFTTVEQETELYIDVIEDRSKEGDTAFIKPHPRSSFKSLETLRARLAPRRNVVIIQDDRFARLPIELWVGLLRHCDPVAMFSTSAINIKYLYDKEVLMPLDERRITRFIDVPAQGYVRSTYRLFEEALVNLDTWDGRSALWSAP